MADPIKCRYALGAINYKNGFVTSCPQQSDQLYVYKNSNVIKPSEIINSEKFKNHRLELMNGVWSPGCHLCKEAEAIGNEIALVEKSIEKAAESLVGIQKHLQERQIAQSRNLADLQNFEILLTTTQDRLAGSQLEFTQMMAKHGFTAKEALLQLFQENLDAEKMDAEIRAYEQQVAATDARIKALNAEEGIKEYSEERFQILLENAASAKDTEKTLQSKVTLLNQELLEISQKLKEKQSLLGEFERIENRETNLRELERLFSGKGFVRYVSSIYLRELCNTANKRFRMLTKNSLSLEIDDLFIE